MSLNSGVQDLSQENTELELVLREKAVEVTERQQVQDLAGETTHTHTDTYTHMLTHICNDLLLFYNVYRTLSIIYRTLYFCV